MKSRFAIVTVSVIVGLLAAVVATGYVGSIRAKALADAEPRDVYVTTRVATAGTSLDEMIATGAVEKAKVPSKFVPKDGVAQTSQVSGRVLLYDVGAGEQLSESKFKAEGGSDVAGQVPKGAVAVSVPMDEINGVGAALRPGDQIVLFATFSPGPSGADITKVLLPKVVVVASSSSAGLQDQGGSGLATKSQGQTKSTVTIAVDPRDAEKVVFAAEKGHLWAALRPLSKNLNTSTRGQTMRSIFR